MPIGFQVINDFGSYQIDDYYQNLFLDKKVRINKTSLKKYPQGNFYYYDLSFVSDTPPVVAVGVYDGVSTACYGLKQSKNQYTAKIIASSNNQDVDVYVFNTLNGSSSTYGLQVFDENGKLIFDALKKPLRLVGIQNQNSKDNPTLTQGRTYAVCHNQYAISRQYFPIDVSTENNGINRFYDSSLGVLGSFLDFNIEIHTTSYRSSVRLLNNKIELSNTDIQVNNDINIMVRNGIVPSHHYWTWLEIEPKITQAIKNYQLYHYDDLGMLYQLIDYHNNIDIPLNYQYMIIDVTNY